ncbi:MAG: glycerol-3-phosphate 1-O-acyltransferase PlsY [Sphingomonadaceae bacterium]
MAHQLIAIIIGYLLGSIPFGILLTRAFGAGDLRQIGSGNIGATNVLRTGRKGLAAATLLLDAAKGAVAVMIAQWIDLNTALFGGAAAFIGHLYPAWLGFKGGKGVATMLGVALALSGMVGMVYALVWLAGLTLTRISSVSGMAAALSAPVTAYVLGGQRSAAMLGGLALLVLWQHRENIVRLQAGTEPRVGQKSA